MRGSWGEDEEDFHERGQVIFLIFSRISSRWRRWNVCEFVLVSWTFRWIIKLGIFSSFSSFSSSAKSFYNRTAKIRISFDWRKSDSWRSGELIDHRTSNKVCLTWIILRHHHRCCLLSFPELRLHTPRSPSSPPPIKFQKRAIIQKIRGESRSRQGKTNTFAQLRAGALRPRKIISKLSEFQLKVFRVSATQTTDEKKV